MSRATRSSRAELGQLGLRGTQPLGELRERRPGPPSAAIAAAPTASTRRVPSTAPSAAASASRCDSGVGEELLLGLERRVLVGVVEAGGVDLADLEAQQVELAGPGPVVAAEPGELGVDRRISARAARSAASGSVAGGPAKRSSAARCIAGASSDWCACWPWRSTRRAPTSASSPTVASRPST